MLDYKYEEVKHVNSLPPLPLKGSIDFTYRCNNNCRHCWLRMPLDAEEKNSELSFSEMRKLIDDAKQMGCREWSISGGEPMLRPDFAEIFDYITGNCNSYSINTNGTLITPKIARLLKKKGVKMIALYGATAGVHDYITRNPGSFELTMRGFRYLREAGANFIVQLVPMKDNYSQFNDMVKLAESLSRHYRVGAAWLYLSACGSAEKNKEIMRQRLLPKEVVELDKPDLSYEEWMQKENPACRNANENGYLFASCINSKHDFHIDPCGQMTFCCFIKEPRLRYDLRKGSFKECWEKFIPSLANKVRVTKEYRQNCGSCEFRKDCRWCPVYAYLEHRRFSARVDYLCAVAKETRAFKEVWQKNHRRYFSIADITIEVESDLAIKENTFHPKFKHFEVSGRGKDTIFIRHHFSLPDLTGRDLGKEFYRRPPWAVYKKDNSWIYLGISPAQGDKTLHRAVVFNHDHTRARIYNDKDETFLKGNLHSLTLFSTDQILLARILADRQGCYLHSCGVNFEGKGLLFAGHSEAGKSTIAALLKGKAGILCDDRMIIRNSPEGFKIFGTWSHGDVVEVSANPAPLKAILFLRKSKKNLILPIDDKKKSTRLLLACLIRPLVTVDWWEKTLLVVDKILRDVPCYILEFDKSPKVGDILRKL